MQLSIGTGCDSTGTVLHEILHALGFWHEQSRPDRDNHLVIVFDNVLPGEIREENIELSFLLYLQINTHK